MIGYKELKEINKLVSMKESLVEDFNRIHNSKNYPDFIVISVNSFVIGGEDFSDLVEIVSPHILNKLSAKMREIDAKLKELGFDVYKDAI